MKYTEAHSKLANLMYTTYCNAVGGKAYDGKPLPLWEAFVADPAKTKQADAWHEVAAVAFDLLTKNN